MTRNEKIVLTLFIVAILLIIGSSEFNYYRTQRELRSLSKSLTEAQQTVELLGDRIGQQESIIEELRTGQSNIELAISGIEGTVAESNSTLRELLEEQLSSSKILSESLSTELAKTKTNSLRSTIVWTLAGFICGGLVGYFWFR